MYATSEPSLKEFPLTTDKTWNYLKKGCKILPYISLFSITDWQYRCKGKGIGNILVRYAGNRDATLQVRTWDPLELQLICRLLRSVLLKKTDALESGQNGIGAHWGPPPPGSILRSLGVSQPGSGSPPPPSHAGGQEDLATLANGTSHILNNWGRYSILWKEPHHHHTFWYIKRRY